jgi:hypothetical protein
LIALPDPANPVKISASSKDRPSPFEAGRRIFGIIERLCGKMTLAFVFLFTVRREAIEPKGIIFF